MDNKGHECTVDSVFAKAFALLFTVLDAPGACQGERQEGGNNVCSLLPELF